jgi:hypothetical protein
VVLQTFVEDNSAPPSERGQVEDDVIALERAPLFDEPDLSLDWVKLQTSMEGGLGRFKKFRSMCEKADEYYRGEFSFDVPDNGTMIRLGTAQSIVDTVVSHVTPQFLDVVVPPAGPRGHARAERIEKFLQASMHMMESKTPTRRVTSMHEAMYGVAWEKTEFIGAMWEDFPEPPEEGQATDDYMEKVRQIVEDRSVRFPIVPTVFNPQSLIWDTQNGAQPRWIIAEYKVDAKWITAHFGKSASTHPNEWQGGSGDMLFTEVWTWTQAAYLVEGQWVMRPRRHGYEIWPWTMYWPQNGIQTLELKPEDLYRGILHGNFEMIAAESRLASQQLEIVAQAAWGGIDIKGPQAQAEKVKNTYDTRPAAINVIPDGIDITQRTIDEPPQTIIQTKNMLGEAIEGNTAPAVTRGQRPRGSASGFETSVLSGIASLNFGAIVEANEKGLSNRNEIVLSIVENVIRDPVSVWGKIESGMVDAKLKPADIKGHTVNMVSLTPTSPEEQERKISTWKGNWKDGWIDHETSLRKGGVSNALEILGKVDAEKQLNSEAVQEVLSAHAAERVPLLQQRIEAQDGTDSAREVEQLTAEVLGAAQQPNSGSFSQTNQPSPGDLATQAAGIGAPVMPGSPEEVDLIGRQATLPRSGNLRVPTSDLAPAGGR